MVIIIFFIAFIFAFSAFFANVQILGQNPFIAFLLYQADFIVTHISFFIFIFFVALIALVRTIKFEEKHKLHHKTLLSILHMIVTLFIGIFVSYVLLLTIAIVQLNVYALIINNNPQVLGIISDQKIMTKTLKGANEPPTIIAADNDHFKVLVAVAAATTGIDSFYGSAMLPTIPPYLVIPIKNLPPSLLIDNSLVITEVNKQDLQTLSPLVGYMFIKHYFPLRDIKFYPKISIMDESEYKALRAKDAEQRVVSLTKQITKIEDLISSTSASLQKDKDTIVFDQNLVKTSFAQKDDEMKKCNAQGYYDTTGKYIHVNAPEDCQSQAAHFDKTIDTANTEIDTLTAEIPQVEDQLTQYQNYDIFFKNQKKLTDLLAKNVPHELGVFKPKDTIRIVIDSKNPHAIADYFATVVHEYFHYISYSDKQAFTTLFFEEGLTEYFARQAIQDNLNTSTNLGYPVFVKIISEMTKRIPETDLADIYLSKDEAKLEETLDKVYGDGFYKRNELLFTQLQYTSDPQQVLTIANSIMKQIGGTPLTDTDRLSTFSDY